MVKRASTAGCRRVSLTVLAAFLFASLAQLRCDESLWAAAAVRLNERLDRAAIESVEPLQPSPRSQSNCRLVGHSRRQDDTVARSVAVRAERSHQLGQLVEILLAQHVRVVTDPDVAVLEVVNQVGIVQFGRVYARGLHRRTQVGPGRSAGVVQAVGRRVRKGAVVHRPFHVREFGENVRRARQKERGNPTHACVLERVRQTGRLIYVVVARAAADRIFAFTAVEIVVAVAAKEFVVAIAAVQGVRAVAGVAEIILTRPAD